MPLICIIAGIICYLIYAYAEDKTLIVTKKDIREKMPQIYAFLLNK